MTIVLKLNKKTNYKRILKDAEKLLGYKLYITNNTGSYDMRVIGLNVDNPQMVAQAIKAVDGGKVYSMHEYYMIDIDTKSSDYVAQEQIEKLLMSMGVRYKILNSVVSTFRIDIKLAILTDGNINDVVKRIKNLYYTDAVAFDVCVNT